MRLVVNADDLGLSARIDEGIFLAHRDGIVTSATLLVTGSSAAESAREAAARRVGLGVHLALCGGLPPASSGASTVAPSGRLRRAWSDFLRDFALRRIRLSEVERELRAQVRAARSLTVPLDHLDAHQHLHVLPGVRAVVTALARDEGLPLRWPALPAFGGWLRHPAAAVKTVGLGLLASAPAPPRRLPAVGIFEAGRLDEPTLLALLRSLPSGRGALELGCHPGRDPGVIPEDPTWRYRWEAELAALTSPAAHALVRERSIELTTYGALFSTT